MLASVLLSLSITAAPAYSLTDLGLEANSAKGVFLSERGSVVGLLLANGEAAYSLWSKGRLTRLPGMTRVAGVNARDQLAVDTADGPGIWEAGKGIRLWPKSNPGGIAATVAYALGIDDAGNLAVVHAPSGSEGGNYRVVTWPKASRIPETYPPVAFSSDGRVLARHGGDGRLPEIRADAMLYDERAFQAVGAAGMKIEPLGVARDGWVCGASTAQGNDLPRPFVWHEGRFVLPFWGNEGQAVGVNERGQAVGEADGVPVLWTGGAAQKLETLLPAAARYRLVRALAINSKGQILVEAEPTNRPFPRTLLLLTPKP